MLKYIQVLFKLLFRAEKNKNKNKNKNDYGSPYPIVIDTTEKPTTKKPVEQVFGDPHFMVSSIGQEKVLISFLEDQSSKMFIK